MTGGESEGTCKTSKTDDSNSEVAYMTILYVSVSVACQHLTCEELGYKQWKSVNLCDNFHGFGLLSLVSTAVFCCIRICVVCQRLMVSCFIWCELNSPL